MVSGVQLLARHVTLFPRQVTLLVRRVTLIFPPCDAVGFRVTLLPRQVTLLVLHVTLFARRVTLRVTLPVDNRPMTEVLP